MHFEDTYLSLLTKTSQKKKSLILLFSLLAKDISIKRTGYILITNAYVYWNTTIYMLLPIVILLHASSTIANNNSGITATTCKSSPAGLLLCHL
jgi:hypothetical protein